MKAKSFVLILLGFFIASCLSYSQYTPKGIGYQAVARDEKGIELKNKELEVRISILANDPNSTSEYSEIHTITTDKYGLFSLIIGQGAFISGAVQNFEEINWGSGLHYLKLEVDFGLGWRGMGTTQFNAVPYALYAGTASNAIGSKDEQKLSYDPITKQLSLENGGNVNLSALYEDSDSNPTNELQKLYVNGDSLHIYQGNTVSIDVSKTNEIQTLSLSGDSLLLSNNGGYVIFKDNDPMNELQHLNLDGNVLTISTDDAVQGMVTLTDRFEDDDHDPVNEIQDLYLDDDTNILKISNNPTANPVYLQKYLDDTDKQKLYITGDSLGIENVAAKVFIDNSKTNELQNLSLDASTNQLSITNNPLASPVSLTKYLDNTDKQTLFVAGDSLGILSGNKVMFDASKTNELQSLSLDVSANQLSITNNPLASPVSLAKYLDNTDKQTLFVTGDSLGILSGNKVIFDASKTNEIQTLSRVGDTIYLSQNGGKFVDKYNDADNSITNELQAPQLVGNNFSLTNNATIINLDKYLDNTDSQQLSKTGYSLSLQDGGTVDLRPDIIAFRALKPTVETSKILYAGDSTILIFPTVKMNLMNGYNNLNGKFTVPSGEAGLYRFDIIYQYSTGQSLKIFLNGSPYEQVMPIETYNLIIYLNVGETIEVLLKSSGVSNPQPGIFSGYRIH